MTTPKRLTEEQLRILDLTTQKVPERGWSAESVRMLLGHVAALEQEVAAAEVRGFERAKAQARQLAADVADACELGAALTNDAEASAYAGGWENAGYAAADRIAAMQDGQRGGEEANAPVESNEGSCAACGYPKRNHNRAGMRIAAGRAACSGFSTAVQAGARAGEEETCSSCFHPWGEHTASGCQHHRNGSRCTCLRA